MYILIYQNNIMNNIFLYYMNSLSKNIQTITIGVLIMVVWVSLWFIIELYLSTLYKKHGIVIAYIFLIVASILLYYLNGDKLNWIANYGV